MCESCDKISPHGSPSSELIGLARRIDQEMPGSVVSEQSWQIFSGNQEGSIPWIEFKRLLAASERALSTLREQQPSDVAV
jgi:hypothetical protein